MQQQPILESSITTTLSLIMQCSRTLTTNITPNKTFEDADESALSRSSLPNHSSQHNPSTDSDQLAYRVCELSIQKLQKEARATEPDLRHVLACNSMQRMALQGLLNRLDTLESTIGVQTLPLLPGADEPLISEDDARNMRSLELAVSELERAIRKGEMARTR